jgi:predicted flap endonuclease-1-like 5' DNA nuclease
LETFDGIGLVCGELLRNLGIDTVSDLLRVGATERGRRRLASEIGVTYSTLLKWIYREDLLRVRGIGRKYSALLASAGVNTATDLKKKNPDDLCQTLRALNRERHLVMRSPPSKTVEIWVHNAKSLEPILIE